LAWGSAYLRQGTSNQCRDMDTNPDPDRYPDRHQNLTICSLAISEKFYANPFGSFCAKLLTDKQTNNDDYISSLAEVMNKKLSCDTESTPPFCVTGCYSVTNMAQVGSAQRMLRLCMNYTS